MAKPSNLGAAFNTGDPFPATAENNVEAAINWLLANTIQQNGSAAAPITDAAAARIAGAINYWVCVPHLVPTAATAADILFNLAAPYTIWTDPFTSQSAIWNWAGSTGSPTIVSNQLSIPCTTGWSQLYTATHYSLVNNEIIVRVPQVAGTNITTANTTLAVSVNSMNSPLGGAYLMVATPPYLTVNKCSTGGVWSYSVASVTYSAVSHLWWRIREASGTIYLDTSPNGVSSWANLYSETSAIPLTSLYVGFECGYSGGTAPVPAAGLFDDASFITYQ